MNNWYLTAVKFTKEFTDGTLKRTTDPHLINAMSFTEAEARAHYEVGQYVRGEFIVKSIAKQEFEDIFRFDDADKWFKAVIEMVMEDADSGKEKQLKNNYLIEAHTVAEAGERLAESLKGLMATYSVKKIEETGIIEVHAYDPEFGAKINVNYDFGSDVVVSVQNLDDDPPAWMKTKAAMDSNETAMAPTGEFDPNLLTNATISKALDIIFEHTGASAGMLTKGMSIDYPQAGTILNYLHASGVIGPFNGTKPRELMMTKAEAIEKTGCHEAV